MLELIFKRHFPQLVYDFTCFDSKNRVFTMEVYGDLPILQVCLFKMELEFLGITFIGNIKGVFYDR